jgi:hypothetical protein
VAADLITAGWVLNPDVPSHLFSQNNPLITPVKEMVGENRLYLNQADEYLLKFRRFFRFQDFKPIETQNNLGYISLPDFNLLGNFSSVNNFDPMLPARYFKWMKHLEEIPASGLSNWLSLMDVSVIESLDIAQPFGVKLTQNLARGRFYWANCPIFVKNENDAWRQLLLYMKQKSTDTIINWAIIEDVSGNESENCGGEYKFIIKPIEDQSNHISFEVKTDSPGWFILLDVWYPGWQAKLDREVVPIKRANYLFRGVYVPPGMHTIVFDYRPAWFYFGCILSGAGILGLLIYFWLRMVRK